MVKNLPANAGEAEGWFDPRFIKIPWSRKWQPTPVFLPGESHGQRSLAGYTVHGPKESDTTEHEMEQDHMVLASPPCPLYAFCLWKTLVKK